MPTICATALRPRLVQDEDAKERSGKEWRGHDLMFGTRYGTSIEPRNFNRPWDRRCEKAGVRKITVHDARRTCGTLLADRRAFPRRHASDKTRAALKKLGDTL